MPNTRAILPNKICPQCGKEYSRKKYPSGKLEDVTRYLKRIYCSWHCFSTKSTEYPAARSVDK